jgi:CDP-6-deoxy-D-xylo-4-hexulose-3-dehydrase
MLMYYALYVSGRLPNLKVIVPAIAWATTVAPAIQLGFEPIMCDADLTTFGLDLDHLERLLTAHEPAAVITVPTLGVPNDIDGLMALKERHGFALMEDCCPALGSTYRGRLVGTSGEMSSMSFYFGHHLSTIEGGAIATDDDDLYDILLHLRSHGWAKDLDPEKAEQLAAEREVIPFNRIFTFYHPGFNFRSTDLNAFIGLRQMQKVDRVIARRVENQARYERRFLEAGGFHVPRNPHGVTCSISFCALAQSVTHRERLGATLRDAGVETRPLGGGSMGRQPFWVDRFGAQTFPVADRIHETSFMLPNHPDLTLDDVDRICDIVLAARD